MDDQRKDELFYLMTSLMEEASSTIKKFTDKYELNIPERAMVTAFFAISALEGYIVYTKKTFDPSAYENLKQNILKSVNEAVRMYDNWDQFENMKSEG